MGELFTAWAPNVLGIGLPIAVAALYVWGVTAARRRGIPWPAWRVVIWMLTCVIAVWTLTGAPTALRHSNPFADGVTIGIVSAVLPLGFALGDPFKLVESLRGTQVGWARGRVARFLMFPGLASLLSAVVLTVAVTSEWYQASLTDPLAWTLLLLTAFVAGLLVNLPLLSEDLMPAWATPPVKTLIAFADGIFDAVPGIVMLLLVDNYSGTALLAVAEAVGIPMIAATVVMWVRADAEEQKLVDAELDAREAAAPPAPAPATPDAPAEGLWWLDDPRFADRFKK